MSEQQGTGDGRIQRATPQRNNVRHWVSVNSALNTVLILVLFGMSDKEIADGLPAVVEQLPLVIQAVIDNAPKMLVAATALGGVWAAFQKRANNEREGD